MSLLYYMDHHVPIDITLGLRARGVDCLFLEEDGTKRWADQPLLIRSTQLNPVMVSLDRDLFNIATQWIREGMEFSGLVYGHQLRLTIGQAIRDLEIVAQVMQPEEMRNSIQRIPL